MHRKEIHTMSSTTVDILMPVADVAEIDTGYLSGFIRRLTKVIGSMPDDTNLADWAWKSMKDFPSVPTKEEVAQLFPPFHLPLPEWA